MLYLLIDFSDVEQAALNAVPERFVFCKRELPDYSFNSEGSSLNDSRSFFKYDLLP